MSGARVSYYFRALARNLLPFKGASALLSSLGALYTVLKCADYFHFARQDQVQAFWWAFILAGMVGALWRCRPKLSVRCKLKDRDISIEIAIGDLFSFDGALIVGTNTTFDTVISREQIDESSIQGQFTKKYYGDHTSLDDELESQLRGVHYEALEGTRIGKARRYDIGTTVRLRTKDRIGYFLATCNVNEHGVASGTFEGLKQALGQLWIFIGDRGGKEHLVMPVLGSGFMRLKASRQVITQEIMKSFIAACAERTLCEHLTIVLNEKDVLKNEVDLNALSDYLRHLCTYTEFSSETTERTGTAVPNG